MYSEDEDAKLKSEVIVNPVNKRRQRTRGNPIAKYFQRLKMVIIKHILIVYNRKKKKSKRQNK